jgi:uncharacterized membrane protein HdeD (DUF308 family)
VSRAEAGGAAEEDPMTGGDVFITDPCALSTEHCRRKWGWIVALGVLFILGGLFSLWFVFAATFVTTLYIGAAMVVAGGWEAITAFHIRPRGRAVLLGVIGAVTVFAGIVTFMYPWAAAISLTGILGVLLIASGIFKLVLAWQLRDLGRWQYVAVSGGLRLLLGALIFLQWPYSGLYVLGLFLGVTLLFEGFAWVAIGLHARTARQAPEDRLGGAAPLPGE